MNHITRKCLSNNRVSDFDESRVGNNFAWCACFQPADAEAFATDESFCIFSTECRRQLLVMGVRNPIPESEGFRVIDRDSLRVTFLDNPRKTSPLFFCIGIPLRLKEIAS